MGSMSKQQRSESPGPHNRTSKSGWIYTARNSIRLRRDSWWTIGLIRDSAAADSAITVMGTGHLRFERSALPALCPFGADMEPEVSMDPEAIDQWLWGHATAPAQSAATQHQIIDVPLTVREERVLERPLPDLTEPVIESPVSAPAPANVESPAEEPLKSRRPSRPELENFM